MSEKQELKIRSLSIRNFKGIETLDIDFPPPKYQGDPDVFVLGSGNGGGKTSVLEAITLCLATGSEEEGRDPPRSMRKCFSLFPDHIKSSSDVAVIRASWEQVGNQGLTESLIYNLGGMDDVRAGAAEVQWSAEEERAYRFRNDNPNPFYRWPVLYLHSYRRISSEKLSLADVSGNGKNKTKESPGVAVSDFKTLWFRVIMESFEFFDEIPSAETKKAREVLEQLLNKYADVSIAKPSIKPDNTIDLQVKPHDGSGTFSLDGLSSGQKEIIATLFYVWYLTKDRPAVVLIDEPELHLNTEWHRTFIRTVNEISPHNQYILATHSFDVFDSVNPLHRALLTPSETALQP